MAVLILLNGPPATGKSTIARRWIETRPLALNLDVDVVRGLLGAWLDQPTDAGLAARELALAMAETHLASGRDVIVPQFLGRADFVEQLEQVAARVGTTFVEIALVTSRDDALAAFAERPTGVGVPAHDDAAALVDRASSSDAVGEMYDAFISLLVQRPDVRRVEVVRGDLHRTFGRFRAALG